MQLSFCRLILSRWCIVRSWRRGFDLGGSPAPRQYERNASCNLIATQLASFDRRAALAGALGVVLLPPARLEMEDGERVGVSLVTRGTGLGPPRRVSADWASIRLWVWRLAGGPAAMGGHLVILSAPLAAPSPARRAHLSQYAEGVTKFCSGNGLRCADKRSGDASEQHFTPSPPALKSERIKKFSTCCEGLHPRCTLRSSV
jgi:hypothetical protein